MLTVGRSRSKSTLGALGCPVMFIKQLTLMVLFEKLLPMLRSARETALTVYRAFRLIAAYDYDPEYRGFRRINVVGYILDCKYPHLLNLPDATGIRATHKPNCFNRKYKSVRDLLDRVKSEEDYMKILHEIGWPNATILGCATYCDCGLIENK